MSRGKQNMIIRQQRRALKSPSSHLMPPYLPIYMLLLLVMIAFTSNAQFIRLSLDIAAKTAAGEGQSPELSLEPKQDAGLNELSGITSFTVCAAENHELTIIAKTDQVLVSTTGDSLVFSLEWGYRNDGTGGLPEKWFPGEVLLNFPLSSNGRLIENMENSPASVQAVVFIEATAGPLHPSNTIYTGNILINIELN